MFEKALVVAFFVLMSTLVAFWCGRIWFDADLARQVQCWRSRRPGRGDPAPGPEAFLRHHVARYFEVYRALLLAGVILMSVVTILLAVLVLGT